MRTSIAAVLVLSCVECLAQGFRFDPNARPVDPKKPSNHAAGQDTLTNHELWLNKRVEFDVANRATNSRKETYRVVIQTGSTYRWEFRPPKPWLRKLYSSNYDVWIPATVQISPPHPVIPNSSSIELESKLFLNMITQEVTGHLELRSEKFPFGSFSVVFEGGADAARRIFRLNYNPPSGKNRLQDNVKLSYDTGVIDKVPW